ncbi:hypothetical protein GCM10010521_22630 [Streptomyces rameus]|uniref:Uncharacterized protein n=1 Tax=Streptomyces rameus TaxID=68261 RepID=A0ABP6N6V9_9ACTN
MLSCSDQLAENCPDGIASLGALPVDGVNRDAVARVGQPGSDLGISVVGGPGDVPTRWCPLADAHGQVLKVLFPAQEAGSTDPRNTQEFRELRGSWILRC